MTTTPTRVRFAPSPTGYLHLGNARTALFNWLYARHSGGQFIVRIEDTDRTRYVPDTLDDLMRHLRWLGLDWDEGPDVGGPYGPYFQSQRLGIYHQYAQQLIDSGHAYRCYCTAERLEALREEQRARKETPGYDRHCRYLSAAVRAEREAAGGPSVVRLAVPLDGETTCHDVIRGDITFANNTLDDLVLLKSDGFPTYHLAVVVDDQLMEITHILRGDEWLSSVPKHILLYQAFGWQPPVMAHLPLILDPSGHGKMSKRKKREDGSHYFFIHEFRQAGYLPEALFNYLSLLGWSYDGQTEIFSREDAARLFDIKDVLPKSSAFNYEKLAWMNGVYLRSLSANDLRERIIPFVARDLGRTEDDVRQRPELDILVPHVQERLKTLADATEWIDFIFVDEPAYDVSLLQGKKMSWEETAAALEQTVDTLAALPAWEEAPMEDALRALTERLNLQVGQLFGIIRVATTGKTVALPLFVNLLALGRERTLARLQRALARLKERSVATD